MDSTVEGGVGVCVLESKIEGRFRGCGLGSALKVGLEGVVWSPDLKMELGAGLGFERSGCCRVCGLVSSIKGGVEGCGLENSVESVVNGCGLCSVLRVGLRGVD